MYTDEWLQRDESDKDATRKWWLLQMFQVLLVNP
jgi:hypothetical protein